MEVPLFKLTREAGADLSLKFLHFVKLNTSSQVVAVTAITDIMVGVLQNNSADAVGKAAELMVAGVSEMIAGAAITVGARIGTDNAGRAVAIVDGTATTQFVVGQCLIGCANADERVTVLFNCVGAGRAS